MSRHLSKSAMQTLIDLSTWYKSKKLIFVNTNNELNTYCLYNFSYECNCILLPRANEQCSPINKLNKRQNGLYLINKNVHRPNNVDIIVSGTFKCLKHHNIMSQSKTKKTVQQEAHISRKHKF